MTHDVIYNKKEDILPRVEIKIGGPNNSVLWINVDGECLFRLSRMPEGTHLTIEGKFQLQRMQ